MKKRLLALLLVFMLVVSLLPVGALADNGIVTLSYNDEEGSLGSGELKTIRVVVKDSDTDQVIEEKDWHNVWSSNNDITVSISSEYVNSYDILSASISKGSSSSESLSADSYTFKWTYSMYEDEQAVLTVYLSKQFVEPEIVGGEIENTLIYYTAYEPALLKLLYDNGVSSVDENTRISGVKFHYVRNYFLNSETQLGERLSDGDELKHFVIEGGLTDTSGNDNTPNNIRYIEISYSQDAGDIETVRVYSNNLRYINVGGNTYEIESNKDSKNIVVFYYEQSVDSAIWTPYDVQFVEDGDSVGEDSMPNPPEYYAHEFVAWTTQTDGGTPFISTTIVEDNTVVYCQERLSTSERPTQIYVMNNNNALKTRLAELFECDMADIDWSSLEITVYGENGRQTNPDYGVSGGIHNGWEDNDAYYLVYNYLAGAGEYENESLTFDEISKITVAANKSDNMPLNPVTINRGIYDGDFSVSVGENASTWRLFIYINDNNVHNPGAGPEPTEVTYTVNYYYDNVLNDDKTDTFTGNVGDTITTVTDKSVTGYCFDHDNLPFTLTADEEQNVITVYYATDANDDDIPDSKQVFIKYVSSDAELGTVSPEMQVETFADGMPTDIALSSTATAKSGAEFVNWIDESGSTVSDAEVINYTLKFPELGKTYTFTANFKTIPVETATLTYDANGGTGAPAAETVEKGTTVTLSEDVPTHADVDGVEVAFGGWSLDDAVVGQIYDKDGEPGGIYTLSTITMAQDFTLYAVWGLDENDNDIPDFKENKYTVTYKDGADGKVFGDQVYSGLLAGEDTPGYEGTLTHPDGLSFTGWDPKVSATVTGTVTYTATWKTPTVPEKPDAPTEEELEALFDDKITVDCVNTEVLHADKVYGYEEEGFTVGEVTDAGSSYTVDVTIDAEYYQAKYNDDTDTKHELYSEQAANVTVELVYDGGWKLNKTVPTIKVVCYTVTIAPANIVAYTGGNGYAGVTDGNGDIIDNTVSSGLPEPGYHITLSADTAEWLADKTTDTVNNLGNYLKFTYDVDGVEREWTLSYVGVYSYGSDGLPSGYVYSIEPSTVQGGSIPVRIEYLDGTTPVNSDNIMMTENMVNKSFNMKIDSGELDQSQVKAVLTVGSETIEANVEIGTGTLTVLSTADHGNNTNAIVSAGSKVDSDTITAVAGDDVEYYVNDSGVKVSADRVQLLVDEVTNSAEYNAQLAQDAIATAGAGDNAAAELFYLDLVDTANGNTKVTLGEGDALTIYWPVPEDAADDSEFKIVHYTGMDRTDNTTGSIDGQATETINVTKENGYLVFEVSSFSPFALVYETKDASAITGFTKELVTDRRVYWNNGIAYPEFDRGDVIVDEGDSVTLIYKLTVTGTEGTEYTISDADTDLLSGYSWSGTLGASGTASVYVAKTFSWRTVRNSDTLDNTAYVYITGEAAPEDDDTVKIDVDIDWDYDPPADDDDDTVYIPNWLNTTDHYSYIVGYEDGTIRPNNNITRAEVATIFYRLLTDGARETWYSTVNGFNDVAYGSWYNTAISTLSRMGIINGYEDGSFKPDAPITRAEFTAIATRFFDYTARYRGAFNDVTSGSWYADYVQAAVDMGLVDGYPDGGFHPNSYITRAETVTIVNRVLHRVPHEDYLLSTSVMNTWPDNLPGTWYYADMQEATNSHDYDWIRVGGSVVEDWTRKLTDPNW